MKKFLIGLAVAAISVTGLSVNTANATETNGDGPTVINIDCNTKRIHVKQVTAYAKSLYAATFTHLQDALGGELEGNIDTNGDLPGGNVHVVLTGDATGGTITITDDGEAVLSASLSDGEFSFDASASIDNYLTINVSFYKDRLGHLCGDEPFTVCLDNTVFLVEAADLAPYLKENPTAVVVNSTVGCPGKPGEDGTNGENGTDGTNGTNGTNGVAGPAGPAGPAGQTVVVEKVVEVPVAAPVVLPRTN